jgi:hypothetical protein
MSNGKVWHTAPDSCEGGPPPSNRMQPTRDLEASERLNLMSDG